MKGRLDAVTEESLAAANEGKLAVATEGSLAAAVEEYSKGPKKSILSRWRRCQPRRRLACCRGEVLDF